MYGYCEIVAAGDVVVVDDEGVGDCIDDDDCGGDWNNLLMY